MSTILNILKPSGVSSNKILYEVKQKFKGQKVGHFGTLDPLATGVLPVAVGKYTKLFEYFLNKDKNYVAVFEFGKTTDTLDSEGKIIGDNCYIPTIGEIENILPTFIGKIKQKPPLYSAIKINGEKAYNLARKQIDVEIKEKEVFIYDIKLIKQIDEKRFLFNIHCSSGTYIRSIVRDIATKLNTIGYMAELIRTSAGPFEINDATTIEDLKQNRIKCYDINEILDLKKVEINEIYYNKLVNGINVFCDINNNDDFLLYCKGELFGIAKIVDKKIKIKTYLKD